MSKISYELNRIRGFVFDVDGVLSPATIPLGTDGVPMRMVNIKDGYALQLAIKLGYRIAIISGAVSDAVKIRFNALGIKDVYMGSSQKLALLHSWMTDNSLHASEVVFVGDDIPDYECMCEVGLPCCPADAAIEIKQKARFISHLRGGEGLAREIIEEVLRAQNKWMMSDKAFGW